jgi:hypothetical protein
MPSECATACFPASGSLLHVAGARPTACVGDRLGEGGLPPGCSRQLGPSAFRSAHSGQRRRRGLLSARLRFIAFAWRCRFPNSCGVLILMTGSCTEQQDDRPSPPSGGAYPMVSTSLLGREGRPALPKVPDEIPASASRFPPACSSCNDSMKSRRSTGEGWYGSLASTDITPTSVRGKAIGEQGALGIVLGKDSRWRLPCVTCP